MIDVGLVTGSVTKIVFELKTEAEPFPRQIPMLASVVPPTVSQPTESDDGEFTREDIPISKQV